MKDSLYSYAVALFDIAKEENNVVKYLEDASIVLKAIEENKEIIHILSSYFLLDEEKNSIIDNSFSMIENDNLIILLKIITKNHIISSVCGLLDDFISLCNESLNVKKGVVFSTKPLTEEEILTIQNAFNEKLSIKVNLSNKIDTSLIGGIRVIIDDHIYDSSLKNKIESLKSSLKKEGVN